MTLDERFDHVERQLDTLKWMCGATIVVNVINLAIVLGLAVRS
jgi:hypothetical protein